MSAILPPRTVYMIPVLPSGQWGQWIVFDELADNASEAVSRQAMRSVGVSKAYRMVFRRGDLSQPMSAEMIAP